MICGVVAVQGNGSAAWESNAVKNAGLVCCLCSASLLYVHSQSLFQQFGWKGFLTPRFCQQRHDWLCPTLTTCQTISQDMSHIMAICCTNIQQQGIGSAFLDLRSCTSPAESWEWTEIKWYDMNQRNIISSTASQEVSECQVLLVLLKSSERSLTPPSPNTGHCTAMLSSKQHQMRRNGVASESSTRSTPWQSCMAL